MADEEVNCLVARCKCGAGFVFAAVDLPEHRKSNAKEIAKLIVAGFRIDNATVGEVRKSKLCFCDRKKSKPEPMTAELF